MRFFFIMLFWLVPLSSQGALIINEIAWMGSAESANDEWIELYNNGGSSVVVDGWSLKDGMNLDIQLVGTIPAGAYAVLERTDDSSAPGGAFLIYTGALANTGATLTLYRQDNTQEDSVFGGENWQSIGGDNVTKETPQYTQGGWVTALATPNGPVGVIVPKDEEEEEEDEDSETPLVSTKSQSTDSVTIEMKVPNVSLSLALSGPEVVYVHQPVSYSVIPSGVGKTILDSLLYEWNFGDLNTSLSKDPKHVFTHAGEYVVTVYASFGRHQQVARKTVTVLPVSFSLSRNTDGDILVHNNAKYEVDISGYRMKGLLRFVFPQRSIILPNATLTVPKEKVGASLFSTVFLYDQEGMAVASTHAVTPRFVSIAPATQSQTALGIISQAYASEPVIENVQRSSNFSFSTEPSENKAPSDQIARADKVPTQSGESPEVSTPTKTNTMLPYLGLLGVLGVGLFAVYAGRKP